METLACVFWGASPFLLLAAVVLIAELLARSGHPLPPAGTARHRPDLLTREEAADEADSSDLDLLEVITHTHAGGKY